MSVRVNADADKASRSTNLPASNNITVFMYAKIVSDTNQTKISANRPADSTIKLK